MDIRQLTYLIEISKHRSINKASEKLYISQQALNLSMKKLEGELGIKLFTHTPQGTVLTAKGNQLVRISEDFIQQILDLQRDFIPLNIFEEITLYTPEPLIENFLAKPLTSIYKHYPNLKINLETFPYEATIHILEKKKLPYCFWYQCYIDNKNISLDVPNGYQFISLLKIKFYCRVNQKHQFKNLSTVSIQQLNNETLAIHTPSRYILDKILHYSAVSPHVIYAPSLGLINELIQTNTAIAFSAFSINKFKNSIPSDHSSLHIPFRETIIGELGYLIPENETLKEKPFLDLIKKELQESY